MGSYKITKKYRIWHNTRGIADEYWLCKGNAVIYKFPKILGIKIYYTLQRKHMKRDFEKQMEKQRKYIEKEYKDGMKKALESINTIDEYLDD